MNRAEDARTILVTGGAGFIGSNFVHYLRNTYPNYRILVLDVLTYAGSLDNLPPFGGREGANGRIEFWHGDVRNASLVELCLCFAAPLFAGFGSTEGSGNLGAAFALRASAARAAATKAHSTSAASAFVI